MLILVHATPTAGLQDTAVEVAYGQAVALVETEERMAETGNPLLPMLEELDLGSTLLRWR